MSVSDVKHEARRLVDDLPEDATWEDLMYRIYVRQVIGSRYRRQRSQPDC